MASIEVGVDIRVDTPSCNDAAIYLYMPVSPQPVQINRKTTLETNKK